jgi:hypothetical protein
MVALAYLLGTAGPRQRCLHGITPFAPHAVHLF